MHAYSRVRGPKEMTTLTLLHTVVIRVESWSRVIVGYSSTLSYGLQVSCGGNRLPRYYDILAYRVYHAPRDYRSVRGTTVRVLSSGKETRTL